MRKVDRRIKQIRRELGYEVRKEQQRWLPVGTKRKVGTRILGKRTAGPTTERVIKPQGQKLVQARTEAKRRAIKKVWPV